MDLLKEERVLFRSGAVKSALMWSIVAYPIFFLLSYLSAWVIVENLFLGVAIALVFPTLTIVIVYYMALKRSSRFQLNDYNLRLEYVAMITVLIIIYDVLVNAILTQTLRFPRIGLVPLVLMFVMPSLVRPRKD